MAQKQAQTIVAALLQGKPKRSGNLSTDGKSVFLFGNKILRIAKSGKVLVSYAGWPTVSTTTNINAVLEAMGESYPSHVTGGYVGAHGKDGSKHVFAHNGDIKPMSGGSFYYIHSGRKAQRR